MSTRHSLFVFLIFKNNFWVSEYTNAAILYFVHRLTDGPAPPRETLFARQRHAYLLAGCWRLLNVVV